MVTIIGSVFAAIQFVIAAAGAGSMNYEEYYKYLNRNAGCESGTNVTCREVTLVSAINIFRLINCAVNMSYVSQVINT